jgi:hypothetical protein
MEELGHVTDVPVEAQCDHRTALPWQIDAKEHGELWIANADRTKPVCMVTASGFVTARDKADAAFIVKACNSYEALVKALEKAQRIIERDFPNGQLAIDIRAALAGAKS